MSSDAVQAQIRTLNRQRGGVKAKLTHFTRFVADMMRDIHNIDVDVQEQDYLQLELRSTQAEN